MLASLDKVEVADKYTVKFTLKEPYVWFLDMLANPMAVAIVAKECVEKFGDLKKPESRRRHRAVDARQLPAQRRATPTCGTRPTSLAGLPYIDKVEVTVDEDNASRMAAFIAGKYDLGWEIPGTINRVDWVQIKDTLKQRRPRLQTAEYPSNVMSHISMRTDQKPFSDPRVRQAMSLAIDRQGILDATAEGVGVFNPPVPAALKEWSLPVDQLGEGAKYYKYDPARKPSGCWPKPATPTASRRLDLLHHLRLHDPGRRGAARPEVPQGRRHRRQARSRRSTAPTSRPASTASSTP